MGREATNKGVLLRLLERGYGPGDKAEAERRVMRAVGRPVKCTYPGGFIRRGLLRARRYAWSTKDFDLRPERRVPWFVNVRDTILFEEDGEMVRMTYFRVFPGPHLVFGGQTSFFGRREDYHALGVLFEEEVSKPLSDEDERR